MGKLELYFVVLNPLDCIIIIRLVCGIFYHSLSFAKQTD